MNKITLSIVAAALCFTAHLPAAIDGERFQQSIEAIINATYGHIDTQGLKALLDAKTPLVLLDARGMNWHDGTIIPGAVLAWHQDTEEQLAALIPNKQDLVIVYCYSFDCPLSQRLATRLLALGYKNVVEYPGGLQEWRDIANHPVDPLK